MFEPKGTVSRRQMVLDVIEETPYGEIVPYEALEIALGVDRQGVLVAVNQAKSSAQKEFKKSLVAVRNVGYRVLNPGEELELAKVHQRRGRRQTKKAKSAVVNADYAKLTDLERVKYDIAVQTVAALERFERRADLRYASRERLDSFIKEQSTLNSKTGERINKTDNEVSELKSRLARLEFLMNERDSA
ncbi:hypothetical protein LITTLEE_33 [Mycobacterium phage LittleE]|uniref:Uncharacterized protein n=1 Tax=Mycobacterium phage LittleE TaxID=2922212 RepID=G1D3R8_9CAUD|nr:hypothetical protein FGG27_gp033 [Mycobacterium phage LittleE]AEK09417.1 hypothetical protein LITTLEE_33 [Mycobacterium phage LittleE]